MRQEPLQELADLVVSLPYGCALWRSTGGPMSLTIGEELSRWTGYRLEILAWLQTDDAKKKRNQPKPPERIPYTGEARAEESHANRQANARRKRSQDS